MTPYLPDGGRGTLEPPPEGTYRLTLTGLRPPSVNEIKVPHALRRGLTYTREARAFLAAAKAKLALENAPTLMAIRRADAPDRLWVLEVTFIFPREDFLVKGWWALGRDGKPRQRTEAAYKRWDVSNLIKLTEDAISEATGVDDSRYGRVLVEKRWDATLPTDGTHVDIRLRPGWSPEGVQAVLLPEPA